MISPHGSSLATRSTSMRMATTSSVMLLTNARFQSTRRMAIKWRSAGGSLIACCPTSAKAARAIPLIRGSLDVPGVLENGVFRSDPVTNSDETGTFFYLSLM